MVMAASVRNTVAQGVPSGFDAAKEAFESGEYEQTIDLLAAYEKSNGTSPRLESLRALAYRDLEKPKESYQAILVYLRLTTKRDMSGSEAHQDMLKLRDEMLEAIEKKYKEDKEELDKERDEEADAIVAELESFYSSPQIKRSFSSALPASLKSEADDANGEYIGPPPSASKTAAPGMDALAELEMWRKISQSTVAMDYFLFIETFPNGQFTEIARKKMHEIGDPVWNEVRTSFDPFKYRDYIKNNPDSPLIDVAKVRMDELARMALEWEKVKDTRNEFVLSGFVRSFPDHPFQAEVKKIRSEIHWGNVENSRNDTLLREFLSLYPESPHAVAARAKLDAIASTTPNSNMPAAGKGSEQSKSATATAGATDSMVPGNALKRFSNVKFEWTKGGYYWSEFEVVAGCTIKSRLFDDIATNPTKDELVFNLAEVKDARSKKGSRAWLVQIEKENGQKFEVTRSTYTRNPRWSAVKDTWNYKAEEQNIAVFGDEATAIQLADELRKMIVECKKP